MSVIYFVALIIIGMFVLLNLFLAILLGAFEPDDEDEDEDLKKQKRQKIFKANKSISMLKKRLTYDFNPEEKAEEDAEAEDDLDEDDDEEEEDFGKNRSLYVFPITSKFRRFCSSVIWWKYFDYIILVLIIVSSILLAIENPLNDPESDL